MTTRRRGRHAATPRSGRTVPLARALTALASALVLVVCGYGWVSVVALERSLNTADVLDADATHTDGATDILLVGSDSRTDMQGHPLPEAVLRELRADEAEGRNTDTIILVRVPDEGSTVHAVSIPRDSYVEIPGRDQGKINSAYGVEQARVAERLRLQGMTDGPAIERESAQAGRRVLVSTVQQLTGVRIDHYAEVNLYGFALLTEAIGGVEVCLNRPTRDAESGADFPAGRQTLSGPDALSFVRQRDGLPRGDLDRIVRQQVFLAAAVNQALSTGILTDQARLSALSSAIGRSVVLDRGWDVLGFARQLSGMAAGDINFVTIPVLDPAARDARGQSIVTVDPAQVRAFVAGLLDGSAAPPSPAQATAPAAAAPAQPAQPEFGAARLVVDVFNGTPVPGLAREFAARLESAGFASDAAGNTPTRQVTMIKTGPGGVEAGKQVADLLGGQVPVLPDPRLADDRITVYIGTDRAALVARQRSADTSRAQPGGADRADRADGAGTQPTISTDGITCIN